MSDKAKGERVFRSFGEFRAHYFPEQYRKEQERAGIAQIIDKARTNMELTKTMDGLKEGVDGHSAGQ